MAHGSLIGSGNLAPYYIIFHFVFAYAILSTRGAKNYLKIDHNVNPRSDINVYAQRAVTEGKMTKRQFNFLQRNEGCHANSVEHFPMFVAAVLFATTAGVDAAKINNRCAMYTIARIIFAVAYLAIENYHMSYLRSVAWWASNFVCFSLLWSAGAIFNVTV